LLDVAFETATAIPIDPHIKDRSKAQEAVVATCLQLDQPVRALRYLEKIENWRRGYGYADLAFYCAENGYRDEAERYMKSAEEIARTTEDWRRDRIRVRIAQTHTVLGQTREAHRAGGNVVESEMGKVAGVRAMTADDESFSVQVASLNEMLARGDFDLTRNALTSYTRLFHRFYDNPQRRSLVEEKIKTSWEKMPIFIRFELLATLAESALEHNDAVKARRLIDEARLFMTEYEWPLEHRTPMSSRLVALRYRAGETEQARAEADALRARFAEDGKSIVNIYRAGALRPLAEAYQSMEDAETARAVYAQAIEEGIENPNSRPRAEDLSATCCSMALHEVEPSPAMWARIREIQKGLSDPW
jgi:hypothetical protein